MAITTARAAEPVREYYQTTIHTGRVVQSSGKGFGLARLGGLINAQVEGLGTPSTGSVRLATPKSASQASLNAGEQRLKEHRLWKQQTQAAYKETDEQAKKAQALQERVAKQAAEEKGRPETVGQVDIVDGRLTANDNAPAAVLDDPKHLAQAEKKSVEEQKQEDLGGAGDQAHAAGDVPRPDVKKAEGEKAPAEKSKVEQKK